MADELSRIAAALDRMAPAPLSSPDFDSAEAFVWHVAPDRLVPVKDVSRVALELLVGINRSRGGITSERQIEKAYLEQINEVYSEFFLYYDAAPLLIVNANEIDLSRGDRDFFQLVDYLLDIKSGRHYFNPSFFG